MTDIKQRKFHDPVANLNYQFSKLMHGHGMQRIVGDVRNSKTGEWKFVKNRYERGSRIYQMQIDYMYLIKEVVDRDRNPYFIKLTQDFINACAVELADSTQRK